ncbi:MAG: hypothetical protein ACP5VR_01750 [Acidimicrobiales bacterium]
MPTAYDRYVTGDKIYVTSPSCGALTRRSFGASSSPKLCASPGRQVAVVRPNGVRPGALGLSARKGAFHGSR